MDYSILTEIFMYICIVTVLLILEIHCIRFQMRGLPKIDVKPFRRYGPYKKMFANYVDKC